MSKEIIPQLQPVNSSLCGQTCVAMICGIHLADAVEAVGKGSKTTGINLVRALNKFNIKAKILTRLSCFKKISIKNECYYHFLPKRCIVKFRAKNIKHSHWVLIWDGKTYNPDPPQRYGEKEGYEYISSFIEIPVIS